ncbi:MAG: hypothetical protein ACR2NN_11330 [Bryobacteraceae bacterium]
MRWIALALPILAFAIYVEPALGCRCTEPSLPSAYKRADSVAQVRIDKVSPSSSDGTVTAQGEIVTAWKTSLPPHVEIVTGEDCAYPLKAQGTYILYLSKGDTAWGTYKCRGNRALGEADRTVRWLKRYGHSINTSK